MSQGVCTNMTRHHVLRWVTMVSAYLGHVVVSTNGHRPQSAHNRCRHHPHALMARGHQSHEGFHAFMYHTKSYGGSGGKSPRYHNPDGSDRSTARFVGIIHREETASTQCAIFNRSYAKCWQQGDVFPGNSGIGKPASERDQTRMTTQEWRLQEVRARQRTKFEVNLYNVAFVTAFEATQCNGQ